ncbi:MAG: hypothetical protein E6H77_05695, partial [Betaproteobacteria bacterium]
MKVLRRRLMQAAIALPLGIGERAAPRAVGYLPWWMADGTSAMPLARLERIVLFDAPVAADGGLDSREWLKRGAALAGQAPLEIALTLLKEGEFERVFGPSSSRDRLYDAHWAESPTTGPLVTRSEANPVAIPRTRARLAALGVPRERVSLSVPLYGWQWMCDSERPGARTRGKGRLLTFAETPSELMPNDRLAASVLAARHGLRRDR